MDCIGPHVRVAAFMDWLPRHASPSASCPRRHEYGRVQPRTIKGNVDLELKPKKKPSASLTIGSAVLLYRAHTASILLRVLPASARVGRQRPQTPPPRGVGARLRAARAAPKNSGRPNKPQNERRVPRVPRWHGDRAILHTISGRESPHPQQSGREAPRRRALIAAENELHLRRRGTVTPPPPAGF